MAKFSEKTILELITLELQRRLKDDQENLPSQDSSSFRLLYQARISLLQDLLSALEFYSNYEFD